MHGELAPDLKHKKAPKLNLKKKDQLMVYGETDLLK